MGSLPSSRLTKNLLEKAENLRKRRQAADQYLRDVETELRAMEELGIRLDGLAERETPIREAYRKGEWETVEERSKVFLDYVAQAAGPYVGEAREALATRLEVLKKRLHPITQELSEALGEHGLDPAGGVSAEELGRLLGIRSAILRAESSIADSLVKKAVELASWSGDTESRSRADLERRFSEAAAPIRAGRVEDGESQITLAIESVLPKASAHHESARVAGEALVAAANDLSLPSFGLESALRNDADAGPLEWPRTVAEIEAASAQLADGLRGRVVQAIESLRVTLESLRPMGVDPTSNLARVEEALSGVPTASPGELPALLNRARLATEEPVVAVVASLLDDVRPRLVEARRLGRDASEVLAAMNRAREALRLKIYSEALAAAQEALDRVEQLTKDLETARSDATALAEFLDRLDRAGFPTAAHREKLERAEGELRQLDAAAAQATLHSAFAELGREAYTFYQGRLGRLELVSAQAEELGFRPAETPSEIARAKTELGAGRFADAGEAIVAAEVHLRAAAGPFVARRVEEINRGFKEIPDPALIDPVRRLLADADVSLRIKEDLAGSLDSLRRAEREFSAVVAAHASTLVEELEEERRALDAMGGAGDELQRQIDEVQQIFNMGDFVKASHASLEIRTRAQQQQLVRSEEAVSHAKLALVELGKMGLDTSDLRGQLEAAIEAAKRLQYADAYRLATGAQETANRLKGTAQVVLDQIAEAADLLQAVATSGLAVESYRVGLEEARTAYRTRDLEGARTTTARVADGLKRDKATAEAREMIRECDLLVEDSHRLGVPTEEFYPKLAQVKELLATGHALDARAQVEPLRLELVGHLRPVLEENLRSVERDLEIARSAGLQAPEVIATLGEVRRSLLGAVPAGVAERIELARSQLLETRGFLEQAERALGRVRDALNEAELVRVDVSAARARMERLEAHLAQREYPRVIELSSAFERELHQATRHHVSRTLAGFQGTIVRLAQEGTDTSLAEEYLAKSRAALDEGKALEALQLATRAEGELERVELQLRIAKGSLETAEGKLGGAASHGIRVPAAESELKAAREAFTQKRYPDVLEHAISASDLIGVGREQHRKAREALDSADRQVKEAMELGAEIQPLLTELESARAHAEAGGYVESTREAREVAEAARDGVDRLYQSVDREVRSLLEVAQAEGVEATGIDAIARPLDEAETAMKTREWRGAGERFARAKEAAHNSLDLRLTARLAELASVYQQDVAATPEEEAVRESARRAVAEAMSRHAYPDAFGALRSEATRAEGQRQSRLARQLAELEARVYVGEKLGVDTTPVMELFSEARLSLEGGRAGPVPALLAKADQQLSQLVAERFGGRMRDVSTELVFAREGLHVSVGALPQRLEEAERRRAGGDPLGAAKELLDAEEELNKRKSAHRELLNLHYLIDAQLAKAAERRLNVDEARRLLDESIRARATDYEPALAKAREALALLHSLLKEIPEPSSAPWPFRRPPARSDAPPG